MPFVKGHKINVGHKCSNETRKKIGIANSKLRIKKICICGNNFYVWPSRINAKFCSRKCSNKSKIGISSWNKGLMGYRKGIKHSWIPKGDKHWSWKGGPKFWKKDDRHNDSIYIGWVLQVKNRDGWKCKINNKYCIGKIVAHHILPWRDYPELRYNVNNGITLCQAHHPRKRAEEKRLISKFQRLVSASKELI